MGILDSLRRNPQPAARAPMAQRGTFGVQRIETGVRASAKALGPRQAWHAEAWNAYRIGEIGYLIDFFGHMMQRVRLFPAEVTREGRIPLADVEDQPLPDELIAAAQASLDRIRDEAGNPDPIRAALAINLKVTGDGHLWATTDDDGREVWSVLSTDALSVRQGKYFVTRYPGDKGTEVGPDDFLARFWRRDPQWPGLSTSELHRVLEHAEGLQLISRSMRNASRSRTAGAGALFFDAATEIGGRGRQERGAIKEGDFFDDVTEYLTTPIREPGSVAGFAPFVADLTVPTGKSVSDVVHHLTFERPLTEVELKREEILIKRIGYGMDSPPELVAGIGTLTHWNAWAVKDETYQAHGEPLALLICDILASAVIRAELLAQGFPGPMVDRVTLGADPEDLYSRPDPVDDAFKAHDRGVVSDGYLRRTIRADDEDAPDPDEIERRIEWRRARRGSTSSTDDTSGTTEGPPATEGADDPDEARTASAMVAAADTPDVARVAGLGDRLARLDQSLQDRVVAASDAAVRRALERALNRTRNRARRTPHAEGLAALTPLRIHEAAATFAALGITDLELVTEGDFDELEDQWMAWVAATQSATVAEYERAGLTLIDDERERLEAEQDENRGAGWAALLALLLALTRTRLTSADPTGDSDVTLGELVEGVLVPAGIAREALSIAGGATVGAQTTPGGAVLLNAGTQVAGGVATGVLSLRLAGDTGLTVTGWRWVHGLPTTPFEPHARLDGQVFQSWQDPVLAADPAQWPHVAFYVPGDHRGCTCGSAPQLTLTDPASSN